MVEKLIKIKTDKMTNKTIKMVKEVEINKKTKIITKEGKLNKDYTTIPRKKNHLYRL